VVELVRAELDLAMALTGVRTVGEISPDLLAR
jgi:isopentenyl diphosphate isomerase/L-lactate dehydrogenase-like FMN-dependent dehydrogenase